MYEAIKNFSSQFSFDPVIVNAHNLKPAQHYMVAGMGGSHLAGGLIHSLDPEISLSILYDYGLPPLRKKNTNDTLVIASSYSGNTEETIDVLECALRTKIPCGVITTGGVLLEKAKQAELPYIELPATGIQPRSALGYSFKAILKFLGREEMLRGASRLARTLNPSAYAEQGKLLAEWLKNKVPLVYSSRVNGPLAYIWKIKFNETGKIPAFFSVFPEVNHNEMTGFDVLDSTIPLSQNFSLILIKDAQDDPRILKRMDILAELYQKRAIPVRVETLQGENRLMQIFSSLILADWTAYYLALGYGADPEQVPMVEEFKRLMKS